MNPTQRVCLTALLFSIAAPAAAQSAPATAPAAAPVTAVAPAPIAPSASPAEPVSAIPSEPPPAAAAPVLSAAPAEAPVPPPPTRPSGASHDGTGHFMIGAAWNVAFPVGSVHHFTNAVSGLGFEFLVRYLALPQLSIGGSTDFQTFVASQPRTTYQLNNGALTATAYNSVRIAVVRATAHYYFLKDGPVLPYAGANIGIGWSTFQSSAADLAIYDNQASVVFGADVGTLFPLNQSKLALLTAFRYSAMPAADFLAVSNVQSLSLQFGVLTL